MGTCVISYLYLKENKKKQTSNVTPINFRKMLQFDIACRTDVTPGGFLKKVHLLAWIVFVFHLSVFTFFKILCSCTWSDCKKAKIVNLKHLKSCYPTAHINVEGTVQNKMYNMWSETYRRLFSFYRQTLRKMWTSPADQVQNRWSLTNKIPLALVEKGVNSQKTAQVI